MPRQAVTIGDKTGRVADVLDAAGCEHPRDDAESLVADALRVPASDLDNRREALIPPSAQTRLTETVARRAGREPLAYILKGCSFRGLELYVDARVLIPEEDSGPLVDLALALPADARVHDVGTGSGAIALAIKAERPDLVVTGSDVSSSAIEVASLNAERLGLGVSFRVARGLPRSHYDLVVANMPFQDRAAQTVPTTPEYTEFQPDVAVFAGPTGLEIIEEILADLQPRSRIALKHATSQRPAIHAHLFDPQVFADDQAYMQFTVGFGKEPSDAPSAGDRGAPQPAGGSDLASTSSA